MGKAPSTLRLILPEANLKAPNVDEYISGINAAMEQYAPLTTGNAPHFVISQAKNLFFSNSSIFAINEKCALFTAAISGGSP